MAYFPFASVTKATERTFYRAAARAPMDDIHQWRISTASATMAPMDDHRIGHGYDLHRLRPGGRLMLGGVAVSEDISPVAHSDGDVALHALVDALLGAIAAGDIGELFPNTDARWKNAESRVFVAEAMRRVAAEGFAVVNADVLILAERPKLKTHKPAIRAAVAALLQVGLDRVNIKAGTNEGCDAIGAGEAIAAHATVLLRKLPAS